MDKEITHNKTYFGKMDTFCSFDKSIPILNLIDKTASRFNRWPVSVKFAIYGCIGFVPRANPIKEI